FAHLVLPEVGGKSSIGPHPSLVVGTGNPDSRGAEDRVSSLPAESGESFARRRRASSSKLPDFYQMSRACKSSCGRATISRPTIRLGSMTARLEETAASIESSSPVMVKKPLPPKP